MLSRVYVYSDNMNKSIVRFGLRLGMDYIRHSVFERLEMCTHGMCYYLLNSFLVSDKSCRLLIICKQFGPRSEPTKRPDLDPNV